VLELGDQEEINRLLRVANSVLGSSVDRLDVDSMDIFIPSKVSYSA